MSRFSFPNLVRGWVAVECLQMAGNIFAAIVAQLAKSRKLPAFNDIESPVKDESLAFCGLFCIYCMQIIVIKMTFFIDFNCNSSVSALQLFPLPTLNLLFALVNVFYAFFQVIEASFGGVANRPFNTIYIQLALSVISAIVYAVDNVRRRNDALHDCVEERRKPRLLFAKHFMESQVKGFNSTPSATKALSPPNQPQKNKRKVEETVKKTQ